MCHTLQLYIDWYFFTLDETINDIIWFQASPNSPLIFTFSVPICSNFTSRETNFICFLFTDILVLSCRFLGILVAVVFVMFVFKS